MNREISDVLQGKTLDDTVFQDEEEPVAGNQLDDDDPLRSLSHQGKEPSACRARPKEVLLFFLASAGSSIGWTSVLSNLVFYTDSLGVDSFVYLNLAVYSPLFPIFLAQALYDPYFDRIYQSRRSYLFRGSLSFFATLVAIGLTPWASSNLVFLSGIALVLGTSSAVLHGTLKQMAAFVYPNCDRLPAAVAAGMQASAALVLIVALLTGFGHCGNSSQLRVFYFAIAAIVFICWTSFQTLMSYSPDVDRSMTRRDSPIGGIGEPLLSTTSEDFDGNSSNESTSGITFLELWKSTWHICLAVMITVGSSMAAVSWFNRVQSQDPTNQSLPQILFYTRLFSDLLGRPATLCLSVKSIRCIGALALIRLSFVPVFIIYISGNTIPKNDTLIILAVAGFAFSSGFLSTTCYQLAPSMITDNSQGTNSSKQAGLINVCFAFSILSGLLLSFLVRLSVDSSSPQ